MALESGFLSQAALCANKSGKQKERKKLWQLIAEHRLKQQLEEEHTSTLRETLDFLLVNSQSCLSFEDVLPLLPPKTKKLEVMPYLRNWITNGTLQIERLKEELTTVTVKIERLQSHSTLRNMQSSTLSRTKKCSVCDKPLFLDVFYLFGCNHGFHRFCVVAKMNWFFSNLNKECADEPARADRQTKCFRLVQKIVSLYDSICDLKQPS